METPKDSFEKNWAKAFEEASIVPSDRVWDGIDNKLLLLVNAGYKRRLLIYKYVAAAAIVIALSVGWIGFGSFYPDAYRLSGFDNSQQTADPLEGTKEIMDSRNIAEVDVTSTEQELEKGSVVSESASGFAATVDSPKIAEADVSSMEQELEKESVVSQSVPGFAATIDSDGLDNEVNLLANNVLSPVVIPGNSDQQELGSNKEESLIRGTTVVAVQYSAIHQQVEYSFATPVGYPVHKEFQKPEKSRLTDLWASVGMGGGSFDLNPGSRSLSGLAFAAEDAVTVSNANSIPAPQNQASVEPGYSYSVGVNIGTKLSDRWAVKGGVGYSYKGVNARSNSYAIDPTNNQSNALLFAAASRDQNTIISNTGSYALQSNYEFMTVPIEAGYLLMDKKFGIMLTSGVETNLLMKSELTADIPSWTNSTDISQYRRVHLSALLGTDFHYIFREHYAFSIEPGYKISINSLTNESSGFDSYPRGFEINIRLRYLL